MASQKFPCPLGVLRSFALLSAMLVCPIGHSRIFAAVPPSSNAAFNGAAALADTRRATAFGERPPGSEALQRLREWIVSRLQALGGELVSDSFDAQTPDGVRRMTNIILKFPGTSGKAIAVTGHYDTLYKPMLHFVGANDAGSSTGFLDGVRAEHGASETPG